MADFNVTIAGQVITLPGVNSDPNWAEGLVDFCQAVAEALDSVIGTFDVTPQEYTFVSNANTDVQIPSLSFSTNSVRSAIVTYSINRETDSTHETETGTLELVYDENASVGEKWSMSREFIGSSTVTFSVDDDGQISFSSTALSGSDFTGNIVFKASVLEQTYD
jgi:hypothetical protein